MNISTGASHGLSPRVRGNPRRLLPVPPPARSIPACAGEPRREARPPGRLGVYPRVCGGTLQCRGYGRGDSGLSPRVRGNPVPPRAAGRFRRSIPACAGEPRIGIIPRQLCEVYPRVCGGTDRGSVRGRRIQGLSPRVRGNLIPTGKLPRTGRSIPACAGEPATSTVLRGGSAVYPRVCGGTASYLCPGCAYEGLSPRVRGNPRRRLLPHGKGGSIPACAGEPPTVSSRPSPCRVYPRVCGGTSRSGAPSR